MNSYLDSRDDIMEGMTDEEIMQFLRENRDRVEAFVINEAPEIIVNLKQQFADEKAAAEERAAERIEEVEEKTESIREEAKEFFESQKGYSKEQVEKVKNSMKDLASAFLSPEVQRHFVNMGIEMMMGVSALIEAVPKPKIVEEVVEKASEAKSNASKQYCAKNPDCPKKTSKKIELD